MDHLTANSALYGKGVFTTIAIRDGEPFLWAKHWRRLVRDAGKVGIDLSGHTEESTRQAVEDVSQFDGRARITFFDESESTLWSESKESRTQLSIITAEAREVASPFRLSVSPYPINSRSPLAGVKSCNYLENILSLDEAKARGFSEAIRMNERGHIVSGCITNVFWLRDQRLFTPALSTGCLSGTTREYILENVDCEEGEFQITDLTTADAVFVTSTGIGIVSAADIDGRRHTTAEHPILHILQK